VTDGYVTRPATDGDAPAIRALTRASYAKWVPIIGREPTPMAADYEAAVRNHQFGLMYLGTELIGLVEMIPKPDHLLIENVAVAPDHQGKGLGRALLVHAERVAATSGYDEIRLYTNQRFESNIQLYLRFGYEVFLEEPFPGRGVAVHMKKPVAA
jgi:GNAT superfamily N-acetyltransferase